MRVPGLNFRLSGRRSRSAANISAVATSAPVILSETDRRSSSRPAPHREASARPAMHSERAGRHARSRSDGGLGRLQVSLGNSWQDIGGEEDRALRKARTTGQTHVRFEARGQVYECDFERMLQVNLITGRTRAIRFSAGPGGEASQQPPLQLQPAGGAVSLSSSQLVTASSSSLSGGGGPVSHRSSTSSATGSTVNAEVPADACLVYPRWLHVWVPKGPVFASGAYELSEGETHNGLPLWKKEAGSAGSTECWVYSTPQQHWAIGGRRGTEGLDHGLAWLYSPARHRGLPPDKVPRSWQHNQPEWTTDRGIVITEVADEQGRPWTDAPSEPAAAETATGATDRKAGCRTHCGTVGVAAAAGVVLAGSAACALAGDALLGDGELKALLLDGGVAVTDETGGSLGDIVCSVF